MATRPGKRLSEYASIPGITDLETRSAVARDEAGDYTAVVEVRITGGEADGETLTMLPARVMMSSALNGIASALRAELLTTLMRVLQKRGFDQKYISEFLGEITDGLAEAESHVKKEQS